ncbi:MAG: Hsp33 family molecular chaperone HslO [Alphaproteobacteria bacterium]|nr:Hsp33 family molecular chaperone HslO [Alphaproteobacteria bacterium]
MSKYTFKNTLTPFYLETSSVRGRMVCLHTLPMDIIKRHNYPNVINHVLAELITLGITLCNTFKFEGIFTLQVQGAKAAPISFLVVDVDSKGNVRACANYRDDKIAALTGQNPTLPELLGDGYLAFTIDQGEHTDRYQGIVELSGVTLRECLQHYFKQSEQLETTFYLTLTEDFEACAIMLQKLPFDAEKDVDSYDEWFTAVALLSTIKPQEALSLTPPELLHRLFWQESLRIDENKQLQFKCRCSKDKIEDVLTTLSHEEKIAVAKEGMIYVSCDYCGEKYEFDVDDVKKNND